MSSVCIIPARGGSKRIPRKNIKDFLGKPIIAYSIEAALDCGLFDLVIVSTDDEEIAKIAKQHGAEVPFMRSEKNSNDFASTFDVIEEVIQQLSASGQEFRLTCCLYPTAPFITSKKLEEAFELMKEEDIEGVFTVAEYSYPIQRSLSTGSDGYIQLNNEEHLRTRSQDLTKNYHDAGQFYMYQTQAYLEEKAVFNLKSKPIILSELEVQDIDSKTDWKLAEMKYSLFTSGKGIVS